MSEQVQNQNDPVTEWVTFRLDEEIYGIDVMRVREVLRDTEITPVPGAPGFVLGIINLRGNVVTVINTRKRFGLPPREIEDATRIIVLESDTEVVGMLVDSVAEVADIRSSAIEVAPNVGNDISSQFIQGVSNLKDELLILVDLNKLLGSTDDG
ncbi:MAG: chemotaxis protein CheW [Thiohalomonadaceae bacterium]